MVCFLLVLLLLLLLLLPAFYSKLNVFVLSIQNVLKLVKLFFRLGMRTSFINISPTFSEPSLMLMLLQ